MAAAFAAAVALVAAAPAQAATLTLVGSKSCYRAGDTLTLNGAGFTPGGQASITLEGKDLGVVPTDAAGNFSAPLSIGSLKGVSTRTLIATDAANPANVGQAEFLGSALGVTVRPRNGGAGRKLRIKASGFTTGKRLYGFCALSKPADLGKIWFAMEEGVIPPSYVYIELNDRQTNTKYKSNLADTTI